jgi:hypothetical protein
MGFSFEKIDSNFKQINDILSNLSCSKSILKKSTENLANSSNFGVQDSKSKIDRSQSLRDVHPRRYKYDSSFFLNRSNYKLRNSDTTQEAAANSPNPRPNHNPKIANSSQDFDYQSYVDSLLVLPKRGESESIMSSIINEKKLDGAKKELEQAAEENQELKK